jgi:hypothetical protein
MTVLSSENISVAAMRVLFAQDMVVTCGFSNPTSGSNGLRDSPEPLELDSIGAA